MGISIQDLIGGNIAEGVAKIIGLFKIDPTVALEKQVEVEEIQLQIASKVQDAVTAEINASAANIQAEAKSGDKFTSRARPTFLYLIEFILAFNYVIVPVVQLIGHKTIAPFELPSNLLWLFGSGFLGYTGARSLDKMMGLPGDSSIELPFNLGKLSNKQ